MLHAVVVNYRTPGDLDRFCRTFLDYQPDETWHLTIANVDPTEADLEVGLKWVHHPEYDRRLRNKTFDTNVGYAHACNYSLSGLTGDIYAMFNADVWFRDDAIQQCLDALHGHPLWGVLGPRQTDSQRRITHAGMFGTHDNTRPRGWRQPDRGQFNDVAEAITVSGAAYFVRSKCWNELTRCSYYRDGCAIHGLNAIGAFLPTQHYYEETWCSYHAWKHGWKVVYYGPAHVFHEWHQASKVGGPADQQMPVARSLFRDMCDRHLIPHD